MTTVTIVAPSKCCHCDVHVYPLQADGVQCAHPECITAFHALQDDRRALEATAIALACVGKHGAEPPQKTAAQSEEENKEIEDLPDFIDSDTEDDDGTEQVPYSADDIGKPPTKTPAGRKPKGALTKSPKGLFFDPARWQDPAILAQCDGRVKVKQIQLCVLSFFKLEDSLYIADVPYVRVSGHTHNAADHPSAQMRAGNTDDDEVPALVSDDDGSYPGLIAPRFTILDGNNRVITDALYAVFGHTHNATDMYAEACYWGNLRTLMLY